MKNLFSVKDKIINNFNSKLYLLFKISKQRNVGPVDFILILHHKFIIVDIYTKNSPVSMMFYNAVRMPILKKNYLWLVVCHSRSLMYNRVDINIILK